MKTIDNTSPKYNIHEGHRERMRTRFKEKGISYLEDHEILELLLYYVYARKDTNNIGHALLRKFGSLEKVFAASEEELLEVEGIGDRASVLIELIGQLVNRVHHKPIPKGKILDDYEKAGQYCMDYFRGLEVEKLILISMDAKNKIINTDVISEGDHSASVVDIRKILRLALKNKAVSVLLAHNHPWDSPNPSDSDIIITGKIVDVLEGIDISVADHIICGDKYYVSMDQRGFIGAPRGR